jgi:lysophosphatidylcholine acyltransferase/lyso-PAF acetyltransferase
VSDATAPPAAPPAAAGGGHARPHHGSEPHGAPATQPLPSADVNDKIAWRAGHDAFPRLLIFPEGTTTNGDGLLSFRSGAFRPGLPVQPACVHYPRSAGAADPAWVSDGPAFTGVAAALMGTPANRAVVTFLPPYFPSPAERADPELYAANVQAAIAAALRVRATQHTYEDIQLTLEALKADYPVEASVVEFNEVSAVGRASKRQAFRPCARTRARSPVTPAPATALLPRSSAKRCT